MDMAFAVDSLKPIPKSHIYARKVSDLDALKQMAALNHLDLVKLVLRSFGDRATVDQIQQVFGPRRHHGRLADGGGKWPSAK